MGNHKELIIRAINYLVKRQHIIKTCIMLVWAIFVMYMFLKKPSDKQCNHDLQKVLMSYKGVITKKYIKKVNDFEVFTGQRFYTEYAVTTKIFESAQVGDSIFKIKNQNFAILKRGNSVHKYEYLSLTQDCECLKKYYTRDE